MNVARLLRGGAIAIALAGVADPVVTLEQTAPRPLTIAVLDAGRGLAEAGALARTLSDAYDVTIRQHDVLADAAACPASGDCVVISDGRRPARLTAGARVAGALRISPATRPGVRIRAVDAPPVVHPNATSTLDLELTGGPSDVQVFDGDVLVGQKAVSKVGNEAAKVDKDAALDTLSTVEWTPVGEGLRELRVRAGSDEVRIGVDVRPIRTRVLFYEPRPSWAATFVRRALEEDPRFDVHARSALGNAVAVSTGDRARLEPQALAEAAVVLVGAPDLLTSAEVSTLERFARARGGSVVLLPDREPSGAMLRLLPDGIHLRRERQPQAIGPLKAAESLALRVADSRSGQVHSGNSPLISRAIGNGRVDLSTALDAWRYRDDAVFERFWQSVVADAADAAGAPLTVTVDTMLAKPGQHVSVVVEWRALDGIPSDAAADATMTCSGQAAMPIRLWPDGAPGRFRGTLRPSRPGACGVDAVLTRPRGLAATAAFRVSDTAQPSRAGEDDLTGAVSAHGGTVVAADDAATLITRLRASAAPDRVSSQVRPLRSPWWIVPFAGCLAGEWWLRRRRGLR